MRKHTSHALLTLHRLRHIIQSPRITWTPWSTTSTFKRSVPPLFTSVLQSFVWWTWNFSLTRFDKCSIIFDKDLFYKHMLHIKPVTWWCQFDVIHFVQQFQGFQPYDGEFSYLCPFSWWNPQPHQDRKEWRDQSHCRYMHNIVVELSRIHNQ